MSNSKHLQSFDRRKKEKKIRSVDLNGSVFPISKFCTKRNKKCRFYSLEKQKTRANSGDSLCSRLEPIFYSGAGAEILKAAPDPSQVPLEKRGNVIHTIMSKPILWK